MLTFISIFSCLLALLYAAGAPTIPVYEYFDGEGQVLSLKKDLEKEQTNLKFVRVAFCLLDDPWAKDPNPLHLWGKAVNGKDVDFMLTANSGEMLNNEAYPPLGTKDKNNMGYTFRALFGKIYPGLEVPLYRSKAAGRGNRHFHTTNAKEITTGQQVLPTKDKGGYVKEEGFKAFVMAAWRCA